MQPLEIPVELINSLPFMSTKQQGQISLEQVQTGISGYFTFNPQQQTLVLTPFPVVSSPQQYSNTSPLSKRETQILSLVAKGKSNAKIGQTLHIAVSTVKCHMRNIFDKLKVQSRTEAVMVTMQQGWITAPTMC
ncbi:response regulator transcription factor [Anaerolineales bacterium HSG25]|nr:response regulator transcription factor [Anaerolineales bacterium HSG25]